jgi:triphosphoribosyl-dephospho-CoA synthase
VRRDGRALERIIAAGRDCTAFLTRLNDDYKRLKLTIGGVADMLGIAFGWLIFGSEIAADTYQESDLRRSNPCGN